MDARIHFLQGALFEKTGRYVEALSSLDRSIDLNPNDVQAVSANALVLSVLGQNRKAWQLLENAVERIPGSATLLSNLGVACEKLQDFAGALAAYDRALALDERCAAARKNRGYVLSRLGHAELALANNLVLAEQQPNDPDAHYNSAETLLALKRYDEALLACQNALRLRPDHVQAMIASGLALSVSGKFDEARRIFEAASTKDPDAVKNFVNPFEVVHFDGRRRFDPESIFLARAYESLHDCDWRSREAFIAQFLEIVKERIASGGMFADPSIAYNALTLPVPDSLRFDIARTLSEGVLSRAAPALTSTVRPRKRTDRLRIAYLSPDFREHLNAYLLCPLIEFHDRSKFEVLCYSSGPPDASNIRDRLQLAADRFVDIHGLPTDAVVDAVRRDEINVLVDTGGFTTYSRPDLLVCQAAPIQVSYLGFPGTLGMRSVQYRVTDRIATPADQKQHWSESLVYLPDTFFAYEPFRGLQTNLNPTRAEYGLPDKEFVFCSFNNYYKIEPEIFGVWMEILNAVSGSVLWLAGRNEKAMENIRREASVRGVSAERLIFAPFEEKSRYLARFALADLFLDTFVFNAMTTACDALAAGLPILTCPGRTFTSRVAASLLTAGRFTEGIARSAQDYRDRAIAWGSNPEQLRNIRREKLSNSLTAPLFDTRSRARQLEVAYREMWRRYEQGLPFESFDVARTPSPPPNRWF